VPPVYGRPSAGDFPGNSPQRVVGHRLKDSGKEILDQSITGNGTNSLLPVYNSNFKVDFKLII
jgi:hypothetical protein